MEIVVDIDTLGELHDTCEDGEVVRRHKWGYEKWLVNEDEYCGKLIVLDKKVVSSFHYHKKKKETFIVLSGKIRIGHLLISSEYEPEDDPHEYPLWNDYIIGDKVTFVPMEAHFFSAIDIPSVILEISTHHEDSDTYRIS